MKGYVHSIESMGLNDGPGIRYIVFLQGCRLRCSYCHNPDTWAMKGATEMDSDNILNRAKKFKPYFDKSGGGITLSGGEPLLQPNFVIELLAGCKEEGINTCLDTSGFGVGRYDEILKNVDLVLLDVKAGTNKEYVDIAKGELKELVDFIDHLNSLSIKTIVRHVVIPGVNDSEESLDKVIDIAQNIDNLKGIELLPYHTLGVNKYEELNIPYRLEGVKELEESRLEELETYLADKMK